MNINIENRSSFLKRVPRRRISSILKRILLDEARNKKSLFFSFLKRACFSKYEINIRFIDNGIMRRENRRIFGRNGLTDVIAFSSLEGETMLFGNTLGDMIINAQIAYEDCTRFGHSFQDELMLLVIHGTLHILGHDHQRPNGPMRLRERTYLKQVRKERRCLSHA